MRVRILLLLVLLPTLASAQTLRRDRDQWTSVTGGGCVGGSTCRDRVLRVPLQDRPVLGVRFHAHDDVGQKADGKLRVRIDGTTVRDYIDIPRRGETFTVDVDELRGRNLVFEAASDDEVMIDAIEVLYSREDTMRRIPRDRGRDRDRDGGWRDYPQAGRCIGGDQCRNNGDRITIALDSAPVLAVRFRAHDAVGARADGKLQVRIDDTIIASYVDVARSGKLHEFDVDRVRGSRLVISTSSDDEVEVADVEVLYARDERRRDRFEGETRAEGGCIGGNECGGSRARIRVALRDFPVDSIRFYARDDVGTRAGGRLRIQIDDHILEYSLDITREGRTHEIDGKGLVGEYLILSPADDDEVVIRDIRVKYGD